MGYKIFHFVNAIVLNEIQYDINYLRDFQCMIACSAFSFLYICLESLRVDSMPATNLHVSICYGYNSRQWIDYAINISNGINYSNLLDLFHHVKAKILQLSSLQF